MTPTPIDKKLIDDAIEEFGINDFSKATIREVKAIAALAEKNQVWSLSKWRWACQACRLQK